MKNNPFFSVERERLHRADGTDTGHDALYRVDTGDQLSVVSSKFAVVTHREAVQPVENVLTNMKLNFSASHALTNNGTKLFSKITLPDYTFDPTSQTTMKNTADGETTTDQHMPMLIIQNAYDKTHTYSIEFGMFRAVCSNGMRFGTLIDTLSIKHIGPVILEEIEEYVAANIQRSIHGLNKFYARTVNADGYPVLLDIIRKEVLAEKYKQILALQLAGFGNPVMLKDEATGREKIVGFEQSKEFTAYKLYNVLTALSTHNVKSAAVQANMEHTIANIFGL